MSNPTLAERFDAKVIRNEVGCWGWLGALSNGRAYIWASGRVQPAYRVSWELSSGPITEGMFVCHHCDNGLCCRPDHLFLGSPMDNARDMVAKGRHALGTRAMNAKLTPDIVRDIRRRRLSGETQRSISEDFGVTRATVAHVDQGHTWKEVMV